jgi:hypothetical protein
MNEMDSNEAKTNLPERQFVVQIASLTEVDSSNPESFIGL